MGLEGFRSELKSENHGLNGQAMRGVERHGPQLVSDSHCKGGPLPSLTAALDKWRWIAVIEEKGRISTWMIS
jgi:hypothetical protein